MTKEQVAAEVYKLITTGNRASTFKLAFYNSSSDVIHVLMADFTASNATVKHTLIDVSLDFASDDIDIDTGPDVSILPDFDKELERIQSMIPELPDDLTRKNEVYKYIFIKGTRMVFVQGSAPAGWRLDTSNDNRMLRMVSRGGGGVGGRNDPYIIRGGEVPSHSHVAKTDDQGSHRHSSRMNNAGHHSHKGEATGSGAHKHNVWTSNAGNHNHTYKYCQNVGLHRAVGMGVSFEGVQSYPTKNTSTNGSHKHSTDMNTAGLHHHRVDNEWTGNHAHSITIDKCASHNHTVSVYNNSTSGSSWQPRYINVITCIKD
jgi:hypothetical protein